MARWPFPETFFSPGFLVNSIIVFSAAVLIGHALLVNPSRQRAVLTASVVWGPFLLGSAIAAAHAPVAIDAIQILFNFLTYSAIAYIGYVYSADLSRRSLTAIVALSGVIPILFGLGQVALGMAPARLSSTFAHANILAFFCFIYISFLFHAQLSNYLRSFPEKAAVWVLIAGAMVALLLTGTRSAYLSTYLFLLCYSGLRKPSLILPLLLLPPMALLIPAVADRINDALSGTSPVTYDYLVSAMRGDVADSGPLTLDSGTWRRYLWEAAWPWIEQHWIVGYGLGSFKYYSLDFFPLSAARGSGAHNIYMQILFEGGIIQLMSYLFLIFSMIFVQLSNKNLNRFDKIYCILLIFMFSVASYSDNMLYYLSANLSIWFIISAMSNIKNDAPPLPIRRPTSMHRA
ncbi:O-antigen ligase family protein [Sphingobium sp. JS3065]|uniref:O-antigen ligase family protein n=1 Tax=Sphingobium sp. JS3065 TaxID=2970925 RepID=UPI002263AFBC|nr:O-antigen ligase family protein [Sphingobium sp. JS3065]UZW56612.1 O-antigen ligase family protein [Sphingobium sp. JS3065]